MVIVADDEDKKETDPEPPDEIRLLAIKQVNGRMRWKPSHPIEEEIRDVAVQQAEHLLREKGKE